jgi:hypothetical protein
MQQVGTASQEEEPLVKNEETYTRKGTQEGSKKAQGGIRLDLRRQGEEGPI